MLNAIAPDGVDADGDVIRGMAVVSAGEARGHGFRFDEAAMDSFVVLGNARPNGVKARFGHPNMSTTALGTFLGRSKNFRKVTVGEKVMVKADLHLDPTAYNTPTGDYATYVKDLATSDPQAFGCSIVFAGLREEMEEEDNQDGSDDKPKQLPRVMPTHLHATDVVDDPAANEAFFNEATYPGGVSLSAEMTRFLDLLLSREDGVKTINDFLTRYLANLGDEDPEPAVTVTGGPMKSLANATPDTEAVVDPVVTTLADPAAVAAVAEVLETSVTPVAPVLDVVVPLDPVVPTPVVTVETDSTRLARAEVTLFLTENSAKITKANLDIITAILLATHDNDAIIKFAENGIDREVFLADAVQELVSRLPIVIELTEKAKSDPSAIDDAGENGDYKKIAAYAKEKKLSFANALQALRTAGELSVR